MTPEEAQKAADAINVMLTAGKHQEAADAAGALHDELRVAVEQSSDLRPNLEKVETALKQFEAAGLRPRVTARVSGVLDTPVAPPPPPVALPPPPPQAPPAGPGLKRCPFCAEEILAAAIKCKHCGEMLPAPALPAASSDPSPAPTSAFRLPHTAPSPRPVGSVAFLSIVGFLVLIGALSLTKKWMEHSAYTKAAQATIEELGKINAATDTGITYMRYSEKIADANVQFQKFEQAYGGNDGPPYESRRSILSAVQNYKSALFWWKTKIEDTAISDEADRRLQSSWSSASSDLRRAKEALERGD